MGGPFLPWSLHHDLRPSLSPPSLHACLPCSCLFRHYTNQNNPGHQPPSPPNSCLTTARTQRYYCHHHHHHNHHHHQQPHRRIPLLPPLVLAVRLPILSELESTRMSLSISPQTNLVSSTSTQSTSGPLDLLTFVFAPTHSHSITVHTRKPSTRHRHHFAAASCWSRLPIW